MVLSLLLGFALPAAARLSGCKKSTERNREELVELKAGTWSLEHDHCRGLSHVQLDDGDSFWCEDLMDNTFVRDASSCHVIVQTDAGDICGIGDSHERYEAFQYLARSVERPLRWDSPGCP